MSTDRAKHNADYYVNVYRDGSIGGAKHYRATADCYAEIAKDGPNPRIGVWHVRLKSNDRN